MLVRSPRADTPPLPAGAFRRTTHVAVGPAGLHDTAAPATRQLHGAVRDVRGGTVLAHARLEGRVSSGNVLTHVLVDSVPADDLVGRHAITGLRAHVAGTRDDTHRAPVAVLLEIPVGVALSGYARMQAARQTGRTAVEVIDPAALPLLADSCAGWASQGEAMSAVRADSYRPPRLPPQVPTPDLIAWHDLGTLRPWWVRRRRRIDLTETSGGRRIAAAFRDS